MVLHRLISLPVMMPMLLCTPHPTISNDLLQVQTELMCFLLLVTQVQSRICGFTVSLECTVSRRPARTSPCQLWETFVLSKNSTASTACTKGLPGSMEKQQHMPAQSSAVSKTTCICSPCNRVVLRGRTQLQQYGACSVHPSKAEHKLLIQSFFRKTFFLLNKPALRR